VPYKILFLVHNLGKTRHFEGVIDELLRRGHSLVVTAAHKRNKPLKLTAGFRENPRIDVVANPLRRLDGWEPFVRPLRQARDYLRFLDPSYAQADKLAARARAYSPKGWPDRFAEGGSWRAWWPVARRTLEIVETLVPSERYYELFMRAHQPDVVLVTPLVDFGSYQTDYIKSAHRIGLPVGFVPFSWDNLTNRGLIRIAPDRVLVWNEHQKREAVTFHGVPDDRVVITGASRFDDFFAMQPATSRAEFCARAGVDPARPILLYLCSSNFVAPDEVSFVRRWICAIRTSPNPALAGCGIVVRPHPAHPEPWRNASLGNVENATIWSDEAKIQADPGLYDSLHHSAAVVGLNTSAMIEAGILGKPVYTIRTNEFAGGQEQTLHFHYLLASNGGLVEVAETLEEHVRQVGDGLDDPEAGRARSVRFVESFVRPRGLDKRVAPIVADEIEHLAAMRKRPQRPSLWHYPARRLLLATLRRRRGI
jgi:hypothetical protein